jgi:two-component SAPR family response regulator
MWQDSDDGGRKAFDITVHRLRKLLAFDDAIEVADRHVSLSTKFVWVDAWALDRLLEPLVPVGGPPLDCQRLEIAAPKALSLFGGPFLAGDAESPWQIATRDRLTGRFQRFAQRLGKHWEDSGQWSRAGQLYQRVVELNPLAESFYRRQMVCLDALDQRAEALDLYRRCRQMLSITLGVSPSQATDAIYRDLLGR